MRPARAGGTLGAVVIFGVPVRFHFTFAILVILLLAAGLGGRQTAVLEVVYFLGMFASVLLHELGHVLVARRYGVHTIEIVLYPIGGVARLARNPPTRQELWIAAAGPAVNVAIWAGLALLLRLGAPLGLATGIASGELRLLARIADGNLFLALFNLLPAFPMDGGRILRSALAWRQGEERATRMATRVGRVLAAAMALYGLITGQLLLLFIAFFVYSGATRERMAVQSRSLSHGWPVRAAMVTDYRTLSHGDTLREAGDLLLATSQQDFPVLHGGQVVGLLDRDALMKAMSEGDAESYVAGVMDREFVSLHPDMDLAEALPLFTQAGHSALVMEGERLLGMLTRENLAEFLLLRRFGVGPGSRTA